MPRALLPRYVSWEMHKHARSLPFPILDIQLLVQLHALGYHAVKVVSRIVRRDPRSCLIVRRDPCDCDRWVDGINTWDTFNYNVFM